MALWRKREPLVRARGPGCSRFLISSASAVSQNLMKDWITIGQLATVVLSLHMPQGARVVSILADLARVIAGRARVPLHHGPGLMHLSAEWNARLVEALNRLWGRWDA